MSSTLSNSNYKINPLLRANLLSEQDGVTNRFANYRHDLATRIYDTRNFNSLVQEGAVCGWEALDLSYSAASLPIGYGRNPGTQVRPSLAPATRPPSC